MDLDRLASLLRHRHIDDAVDLPALVSSFIEEIERSPGTQNMLHRCGVLLSKYLWKHFPGGGVPTLTPDIVYSTHMHIPPRNDQVWTRKEVWRELLIGALRKAFTPFPDFWFRFLGTTWPELEMWNRLLGESIRDILTACDIRAIWKQINDLVAMHYQRQMSKNILDLKLIMDKVVGKVWPGETSFSSLAERLAAREIFPDSYLDVMYASIDPHEWMPSETGQIFNADVGGLIGGFLGPHHTVMSRINVFMGAGPGNRGESAIPFLSNAEFNFAVQVHNLHSVHFFDEIVRRHSALYLLRSQLLVRSAYAMESDLNGIIKGMLVDIHDLYMTNTGDDRGYGEYTLMFHGIIGAMGDAISAFVLRHGHFKLHVNPKEPCHPILVGHSVWPILADGNTKRALQDFRNPDYIGSKGSFSGRRFHLDRLRYELIDRFIPPYTTPIHREVGSRHVREETLLCIHRNLAKIEEDHVRTLFMRDMAMFRGHMLRWWPSNKRERGAEEPIPITGWPEGQVR